MSIDVIERRRAVEQRLLRARNCALAIDQATADLAARSGMPIDALDPDGSLRTALSALAGVAALRPGFDVLLSLPGSALALRLRHLADDIDIALVPPPGTAEPPEPADPADPPGTPVDLPVDPSGFQAESAVASDLAAELWRDVGPPA